MTTKVQLQEDGEFLCICGNTLLYEGAYPCTKAGVLVEPTPEQWPDDLYCCDRCGIIFNGNTGAIEGAR